jgi:hypothetical protein
MAEIDISDAVGASFQRIVRKPLTVLAWGALPMAVLVAVVLSFGGGIITSIVEMARAGVRPPPGQVLGLMGAFLGAILVLIVSMAVVGTVVRAAAIRAELEPERGAFAYLRLGAQELWVFASLFVLAVVLILIQIAIAIPMAIVFGVAIFGAALSSGQPHTETMVGLIGARLLIQLVITAASLWVWLRLCLGPVMSFRERQFRLFESWALTKGREWRMLLAMLLVFLIVFCVYLILALLGLAGVVAVVGATPGMSDPQTFFARPPALWMPSLIPFLAVFAVLGAVLVGVANALVYGALARMYRQLRPDGEAASAFV